VEAGGERWRRSGGYAGGGKVSTCGVCNPLQGEADVYEWRLGESDGEDLEVMLEGEGEDLLLLPQGQGGHTTTRDHDDNSSLRADFTVKGTIKRNSELQVDTEFEENSANK
jgi:hypothetical protein